MNESLLSESRLLKTYNHLVEVKGLTREEAINYLAKHYEKLPGTIVEILRRVEETNSQANDILMEK